MLDETFNKSAYSGTKNFSQQDVKTANASGFGAAADDYMERGIDLNEQLIMNKPATYFFRMNSDAMENAGIYAGDVLIVDRSIKITNGKIIVAAVDGELFVRKYEQSFQQKKLVAENKRVKEIILNEFTQFMSWGVVTCVIHLLDESLQAFNKNTKAINPRKRF